MSFRITLAGVDASSSKLPVVQNTLFGLPADDLVALYLCEDGEVGENYTGAITDATQNGNHGTLISLSAVKRIAAGFETRGDPGNSGSTGSGSANMGGFAFDTGVPCDGSFTWVLVAKQDENNPNEAYPVLWSPKAPSALPYATMDPRINVNLTPDVGNAKIRPNLFKSDNWATGGVASSAFDVTASPTNRFVLAMSFDEATGTFRRLCGGVQHTFVDETSGDWMLALEGTHVFGYARESTTRPQSDGEFSFAALFTGVAMGFDELAELVTGAKSIMAERGETGIV